MVNDYSLKNACFAVCLVAASLALGGAPLCAQDTTSQDAYVHFDERDHTWTLGTSWIEEKLQLAGGAYRATSLQNKLTHVRYITRPTEEFRAGVNGALCTSATGNWSLQRWDATVLHAGEVRLVVRLENQPLQVEKTYVVYPRTGIIRQWTTYRNAGPAPIKFSDPYFLTGRVQTASAAEPVLNYMTGGGYFTGSQILKQVALSAGYARTFDSADKPELAALDGVTYGYPIPWGSGAYLQWFCLRDAAARGGLFVGFDYWGRWAAEIGNFFGAPGFVGLRVVDYRKNLAPGESATTPLAFTGVFEGDLDAMGKQLKDWQYRYLWDYTSDEYFARIRFAAEMRWQRGKEEVAWGGGTQDNWDFRMSALFHAADVMRFVGADILWQDAGWHDQVGDNDGPDFAEVKSYLNKSGMGLAIRWPLYTVSDKSRVYREHPAWRTSAQGSNVRRIEDVIPTKTWISEPGSGGSNLDPSQAGVIQYLRDQLDSTVAKWGDYQWRLDGTSVVPVNRDETPMLAQYQNMMGLMEGFRRAHPHSSIDVCAGGGNLMGFETLRVSDVSQLTDGGSVYNSNYFSSYLFPPDKIDDWTRDSNFTWEHARSALTMAAAWMGDRGLYGHEPGLLLSDGMENLRKTFETYHYLVQYGVAGRWSQVYHPKVVGDDPVYYFERLSADGKRGVIILKRFTAGQVVVFPKGLDAQASYDIRYAVSKRVSLHPGAELMQTGITLTDPAPGELIFLNLPDHPGSGMDHVPPTAPVNVRKTTGTNLGVTGVELEWQPSTDNNWLSYYQIYHDGQMIDKVAKGTYYFDHSGGPENILSNYAVQAVDGDGNTSPRVDATLAGETQVAYSAEGGFLAGKDYSYWGANGWTYEEWAGTGHAELAWNGALGQMGVYRGSLGIGPEKPLVGASWMKPGEAADAVRTFTVPYSGVVRVSAKVHKDIYHTYGDGVRVKAVKNGQQFWPQQGWQIIAANDVAGKTLDVVLPVRAGDKLSFVVNCNGNSIDDDTVWNPSIVYTRIDTPFRRHRETLINDNNSFIQYRGEGWQELGRSPWRGDIEQGYLPGWIQGNLSVSGHPGDKMYVKFRGTGIEIFGLVASNSGRATITLDGKRVARIDTFVPENLPARTVPKVRAGAADLWPSVPPTRLWSVEDLPLGEHSIELTVTGEKNAESTGTFMGIDAMTILDGTIVDPSASQ